MLSIFFRYVVMALLLVLVGCATRPTHTSHTTTATTESVSREAPPAPTGSLDETIERIWLTDPTQPRTLDLTAAPDDVWQRIRNSFAVPNLISPLVLEWQSYYAARPEAVRRMAERASRYLYHVVQELERRGMPTELALLPFIESAYNPMALSSAQASGMWQFIPSTGRHYNLKQDWWRDERRDVIASTQAALDYLAYLFEFHGDWHLALASYNWGEGSVKRAIEKNRANGLPTDYLSLDMPNETRNYVPKLQAIKNLIATPDAFQLTLPTVHNQPYFAGIKKDIDIDLATAARLADMSLEEFKALNPSFNRPIILGAHNATLLLPASKVEVFRRNLEREKGSLTSWTTYTVGRKDRFDKIASRFGISTAHLRQINGLNPKSRPTSGMVLLVPSRHHAHTQLDPKSLPTDSGKPTATQTSQKHPIKQPRMHVVKPGDTLFALARQYDVEIGDLKRINRLQDSHLKPGQKIMLQ